MIFPVATGAVIGLLPGIAQDYGVSGQHMAWMNGLAGALLTAGGSLAATLIPARIRASVAYLAISMV
jgi:PAT family beta-lactamase induction signal transducer AmpG